MRLDTGSGCGGAVRRRTTALAAGIVVLLAWGGLVQAESRLDDIRKRGHLGCGVLAEVPGFAERDAQGRYVGFEIDFCRALAAAILGDANDVRFVTVRTVDQFLKQQDVDVAARRLTWTLRREAEFGLMFSPIIFYDGAGFLVTDESGIRNAQELGGRPLCVRGGSEANGALRHYFEVEAVRLAVVPDNTLEGAIRAFDAGDCDALVADVSELAAIRTAARRDGKSLRLLAERISKEPLALVARQGDERFYLIVRWTVLGLIAAEESGISSQNIDKLLRDGDRPAHRLLGKDARTGRGLGLDSEWLRHVVRGVGNYGEIYDRNLGDGSSIGLERGLNRLWTDGGLMYSPPLH